MKEAKGGLIKIRTSDLHSIKTHVHGDFNKKNTKEYRDLHKSREQATLEFRETLDVSDLKEFTRNIHEQDINWPFKEFLTAVLPWWEARAAEQPLVPVLQPVEDPYMISMREHIYGLQIGK